MKAIKVIDVRTSPQDRRTVNAIIKSLNTQKGSKFLSPSFSVVGKCYQTSQK